MNPIKTGLLIFLAVGLFGFIMLYERHAPSSDQDTHGQRPLFPGFKPVAATSIEVIMRTNRVLRAERTNNTWTLVMPFRYPAYSARIENLLTILSQLKRQAHISASELLAQKQPLSAFGLDPPQATVIAQAGTQRHELRVGGRTPVGNRVYVQLIGTDGVFFTDAAVLDRLPGANDDWRDPTFLPLKGLSFDRINVLNGPRRLELVVDPATRLWKLSGRIEARADNYKISQLLTQLQHWPVRQFLSESTNADLETLGLNAPETVLTFGLGSNDLLTVHFGKSPTNDPNVVYARRSAQSSPVLVSRQLLDKLKAHYNDFRDRQLFSVPRAPIDLIEIQAKEKFTVQKQARGGWFVLPQKRPADGELVQQFLGNLTSLQITEFVNDVVTDFSGYGLATPTRRYALGHAISNMAGGVSNAMVTQIDFGNVQGDQVLVRLSGETSVYATPLEASLRLPLWAFELYDRQLWQFKTNEVNSLTVAGQGQTRKLVRNPIRHWTVASSPAALVGPVTNLIDELVYRLGVLRAEAWTAQGDDPLANFGFPEVDHHLTLELLNAGKPQSLSLDFGRLTASQNIYAATQSQGQRLIFELRRSLYELFLEVLRQLPAAPPAPKP